MRYTKLIDIGPDGMMCGKCHASIDPSERVYQGSMLDGFGKYHTEKKLDNGFLYDVIGWYPIMKANWICSLCASDYKTDVQNISMVHNGRSRLDRNPTQKQCRELRKLARLSRI